MDSEQILNLIAARPPVGASRQPTLGDARAAGLDYECVLSAVTHMPCVVFLRDPKSGWTREWHQCRDWELVADDVRRCTHVNGTGERCSMWLVGDVANWAENVHEYVAMAGEVAA